MQKTKRTMQLGLASMARGVILLLEDALPQMGVSINWATLDKALNRYYSRYGDPTKFGEAAIECLGLTTDCNTFSALFGSHQNYLWRPPSCPTKIHFPPKPDHSKPKKELYGFEGFMGQSTKAWKHAAWHNEPVTTDEMLPLFRV